MQDINFVNHTRRKVRPSSPIESLAIMKASVDFVNPFVGITPSGAISGHPVILPLIKVLSKHVQLNRSNHPPRSCLRAALGDEQYDP